MAKFSDSTQGGDRRLQPGLALIIWISLRISWDYKVMVAFVKAQMQKDVDYGVIPGTKKPTLLKPGAEKLCRLFNLRPILEIIHSVVDFEKPLFHYHYRCSLYRGDELVGQGDGCCNSMEVKYQKQKYKIFDLTNTICSAIRWYCEALETREVQVSRWWRGENRM